MSNIVSRRLYLLSHIRKYLSKNVCTVIFKTIVLFLIEYGDIVYAGTCQGNLNKIVNLFNRGLSTFEHKIIALTDFLRPKNTFFA